MIRYKTMVKHKELTHYFPKSNKPKTTIKEQVNKKVNTAMKYVELAFLYNPELRRIANREFLIKYVRAVAQPRKFSTETITRCARKLQEPVRDEFGSIAYYSKYSHQDDIDKKEQLEQAFRKRFGK